jgi:phosphotransferase system enzyme I (PtsI)
VIFLIYQGIAASQGFAIGEVFHYVPFDPIISERTINEADVEENIKAYNAICDKARQEIYEIIEQMEGSDSDKLKIFSAHIEIVSDIAINEDVYEHIRENLYSPDYALNLVYDKYIKIISKSKDPIIRERAADLKDVKLRLLRLWLKVCDINLSGLKKPVIVVAKDLTPSDTATMKKENVLAIITEDGGITSHTAILAKSFGIPAVLGIPNIMQELKPSDTVVVDAVEGQIITGATQEEIDSYTVKQNEFKVRIAEIKKYFSKEPLTADNIRIDITLNIGSVSEQELACKDYTDGVGLFRTEFLYMKNEYLPSEDEQFEAYKKVLETYGGKPVIIRTLDIGGDKKLHCMDLPKEDNPFLGLRALRLCFDNIHIFKTQLRALYRASMYGNLWIMFPMVGSLGDLRFAKKIIEEVKIELAANGYQFNSGVKIGIMIEIPSIAMMADIVASEVDFASIGSNDLCQYLIAVDRLNPRVAQYYQSYHPALFRVIGSVVRAFNEQGKPISICGELGGEPLATPVLIGLGLRKLSMNESSIAAVKKQVSVLNIHKAERMAKTVLDLATAAQVEAFLKSEAVP